MQESCEGLKGLQDEKGKGKIIGEDCRDEVVGSMSNSQEEEDGQLPAGWTTVVPEETSPALQSLIDTGFAPGEYQPRFPNLRPYSEDYDPDTEDIVFTQLKERIDMGYGPADVQVLDLLNKDIGLAEECLEGLRPEEGLSDPHSLTWVDIKCALPRAGLGPEDMNLLGLEEEEIGLAKPFILQDYISPPRLNKGPFEVQISPNSIDKCRQACSTIRNKGKNIELGRPTRRERLKFRGSEVYHGRKQKFHKEAQGKEDYIVEFPSENETIGQHPLSALSVEEEGRLVMQVQHTLSLKRSRSDAQGLLKNVLLLEYNEAQKKMKTEPKKALIEEGSTPMIHDSADPMAEEAGLNMPPKEP